MASTVSGAAGLYYTNLNFGQVWSSKVCLKIWPNIFIWQILTTFLDFMADYTRKPMHINLSWTL
jgi:hypothetical protein